MLLAFLAVCSGIAQVHAEVTDSRSLIANGDFESDEDQDGWPDGWARPKAGGQWEAGNGQHWIRLTAANAGETVLLYQRIAIADDVRALELSWRWRVSDLLPGKQSFHDARIMIGMLRSDGTKSDGAPAAISTRKNTDGWIERKSMFLVPAGVTAIEFMPTLMQVTSGSLELDDVSLRSVDPAPIDAELRRRAEAQLAKQQKDASARQTRAKTLFSETGNLITNGDFERPDQKSGDRPQGWGLPKGGSWELEGSNRYVRLRSREPGQTVLLYRLVDLPDNVGAVELRWRERVQELKVGQRPWFDARIMLNWKDASGKTLPGSPSAPSSRKDSDGWRARATTFLVPQDAVALEFMPALFQVQSGTFDLDDLVLKTSDPAPLLAAAAAKAAEERRNQIEPEEPNRAAWPPILHVDGQNVLTPDHKPVRLQGVNVVSLEFLLRGDHVLKACQVAVDDWHSNIVRLPVKETYWFGRDSEQTDGGASYRKRVDDAITIVANRGAYVLLDLHRFRAPKAEHLEFWESAAAVYKDHPAVLFDLFNEPHGVSWEVWRDGGFVSEKRTPADEDAFLSDAEKQQEQQGFESVGMQRLIDAVRQTGARNIVVAGGLDWAYDLSGIAEGFALNDRAGNGLIYSTHIYPWKSGWKEKVLVVAERHPVLVGEVGCDIKKLDFIPLENQENPFTWAPDMLGFMQQHGLHWTAFSFHPSASPVMITGWDFAPTEFWGAFVKRALAGEQFPRDRSR